METEREIDAKKFENNPSGTSRKAALGEADQGDAKEGGMPSFKGCVTKTDVKNIGAYLHSIGTKNEPTWLDWWNLVP